MGLPLGNGPCYIVGGGGGDVFNLLNDKSDFLNNIISTGINLHEHSEQEQRMIYRCYKDCVHISYVFIKLK